MRFRLTSFHKKSAFSATAHSENSESGRLSYFIQFFCMISWVFEIQTNGYTESCHKSNICRLYTQLNLRNKDSGRQQGGERVDQCYIRK